MKDVTIILMVVVDSISKGFRISLKKEFFLPFFLLNLLVAFSLLILILPVMEILPTISSFHIPESANLILNLTFIGLVFVLYQLVLLWFDGAVMNMIKTGQNFERSLTRVKSAVPSLIFLGILLLVIHGIILVVVNFFPAFSLFFRLISLLVDILFMFTPVSIVIKNDSVEIGVFRSAHLVKKNLTTSVAFLILNNIVCISIIVVGALVSIPFLMPTFFDVMSYIKDYELGTLDIGLLEDLAEIVKQHYLGLVGAMLVFLFFFSVQRVFNVASKTVLFLKLVKRKSEIF